MKLEEFHRLYRSAFGQLCIYALHYLMDVRQAEDAVQDSFVKMWEFISGGGQITAPLSWLHAVVRNECINTLKKRGDGRIEPVDLDGLIDDSEAIDRSAEEARLWKAIDSLPLMQRRILLLSKRDGLKNSEIAAELGIAEQTVKNQLGYALRKLRSTRPSTPSLLFILAFLP